MSRWLLCVCVLVSTAFSPPVWGAPLPYEPDYPYAPVVFRMFVTNCDNVPMPNALVSVTLHRGNQVYGPYNRFVDRDGIAWVNLPTDCCDEVWLSITPAPGAPPYETVFHRRCDGYCPFSGFGEIAQEIPADDPCHPEDPEQGIGGGDPPPCCNELMPDGVTWHIRYRVTP